MKKKKFKKLLIWGYLFLFILVIIYYFRVNIYKNGWHLIHPNPITWNQLEINVPDKLVATFDEEGKKGSFDIYSIENPNMVTIIISKFNKTLTKELPYQKQYYDLGYEIVEEIPCQHPKFECKWYKAELRNKEKSIYKESIVLLSTNYAIGFFGIEENRHHLIEVFENLKLSKN